VETTTVAVWLIGAGALMIALGLVLASERPYEGVSFRGPLSTRAARLRFAVEAAGASLVAAGSVLLAVVETPCARLLLILPIAYTLVHAASA
jgi:cytochrome c biogenesis protein CcdA